jgi:hypothetical protein
VDADFICNKIAVLGVMVKETSCTCKKKEFVSEGVIEIKYMLGMV